MAAIDFAGNAGSSVAYNPGDTLEFDASFNAGDLEIVEDSGNLVFTNAGTTVTLLGVTLATLSSADLVFLDGSQAFLNENGVGTVLGDYFDLRASGQFNMSGGSGEDEFYAGDQLDALDQISGGGGADQLTIEGSTTVVFTPTTVVGVETFELRSGSIDLTIADETVLGNRHRRSLSRRLVFRAGMSSHLTLRPSPAGTWSFIAAPPTTSSPAATTAT